MKQNMMALLVLFILTTNAFSQTIEELCNQHKYQELIEYSKSETLTKDEFFFVGYAYFQLEDDANAIKMYDLAIKNGLDKDYVYLYKGLSFRYDKQYDKAKENFRIAIQKNPNGQKNYTELANTFYLQYQYDSALTYFYKARELKFELGDPYLKIPYTYLNMHQNDKALEEFYKSAEMIDKSDPTYIELLKNIGLTEYTQTKNYSKSIKAFSDIISIKENNYFFYPFLIKAYYANENFKQGDSIFDILKEKYEKGELPDDFNDKDEIPVDQFYWNDQLIIVLKSFKPPTEFKETIYRFLLSDKSGKKNIKMFMTEKTIADMDGTKH